jgi:predicted nucleotidyltransferase component of viral defense system
VVASVAARLLAVSKSRREEYQLTLERYAAERFLARLVASSHADLFVLKGAMLHPMWAVASYRTTRDIDFHATENMDRAHLESVVRAICETSVDDDGLRFDFDTLRVEAIREDNRHGGQRVSMLVFLGRSRIRLQIDVGFGDVITPGASTFVFPTLLGGAGITGVRAYPIETVIAEKLEAIVSLGSANSRLKDFYDVWMISEKLALDGEIVGQAVARTFERRHTPLPEATPEILTTEYAASDEMAKRWSGFMARNSQAATTLDFAQVSSRIREFAFPIFTAIRGVHVFNQHWSPGGPWSVARSSASNI